MTLQKVALIKRFDEIGIADRPNVGGKGANLGELQRAGIRVPPGFVVTTAAFEQFLMATDPEGKIRRAITKLAPEDLDAVTATCREVRAKIEQAALPGHLRVEIASCYGALNAQTHGADGGRQPVAVRSSATSEDSAKASFAGLQDTYLWVRGVDSVLEHVQKCWASLYAVESVTYRRRLKLPEQGLAMGVVVQRMIDARISGVAFTRSPSSGDRSVVVIEASWGLGSAVVSGDVTPDKYVVGKIAGDIVSRTVSRKLRRHRPNPQGSGVIDEEVPAEQQELTCLSDPEIHALAGIAKQVELHYGYAQDIEWAIAGERGQNDNIFLLQSRPETVWAAKDAAPVATPKGKAFDHVFSLLGGGAAKP